ncbi:protein kinase [Sorangium cellulosum]|uniref:Protein kinase n=1 Tax=Sorangium cellulosum TaxID=56 RepID=A0A4P2Q327_SORCE|nr:serine/threonine-protein kinase [Sorangium cellulosum]AUX23396.1 protein kinase [Sorangium cellulosum]
MTATTRPLDPAVTLVDEASVASDDLAPGTLVGEFLVEAARSHGGFAVVYLATQLGTGRPVALKVLRRRLAASTRILARFQQEAAALRGLAHPHLVEIVGVGDLPDGRPYLAMEWIEGRTLKEELRARGALSAAEALAVLEEIGGALSAAHALGIVHRDVKAQNIMAIPRGGWFTTRLVDLGIAKLLEPERLGRDPIFTQSSVLGTPGSMAPEQIAGRPVDARTDVYALGLLLYEMLTGQPAFQADDLIELEELQLFAPPPRASDLVPVPPGVDAAIARCLEKSPDARYPSVAALLAELRAAPLAAREEAPAGEAAALHVGVQIEGSDGEDEIDAAAFDDAEAVLAMARRAAADAGLVPVVDGGGVLVGATALPGDPEGSRAARARLVRAARALEATIAARPRPSPAVQVALVLHAAPARVQGAPGRQRFQGGELLRVGAWTAAHRGGGLTITPAARAGLDEG